MKNTPSKPKEDKQEVAIKFADWILKNAYWVETTESWFVQEGINTNEKDELVGHTTSELYQIFIKTVKP